MTQSHWRLLTGCLSLAMLTSAYVRTSSIPTMTKAANAFLNSLTPEQRSQATFKFEDDQRFDWHFIPKPRKGLTLGEMEPYQRHLAMALLSAGMSQTGFIKTTSIMSLEEVLKIMEKDSGAKRNPLKYHFSVFGQPSDTGTWGFRIEGHHVSQNFTIHNGKVVGGPSFFGANPHEIREGSRKGLRPLAAEEDYARELVSSLDANQKKAAIIQPEAYKDILTMASRKAAIEGTPTGVLMSKLNAKQKELLTKIIDEYVYNAAEQVAQDRQERVKKSGSNVYFAWAGPIEKGAPQYYRVQGTTFLIEYDNTQNNANHSHTVWRAMDGDFGLDLLKEHYQSSHSGGR